MAGVHRVLNHSSVLVDRPSLRKLLALSEAQSLSDPGTPVDGNVDGNGRDYMALAQGFFLC